MIDIHTEKRNPNITLKTVIKSQEKTEKVQRNKKKTKNTIPKQLTKWQ